MYSDWKRGNCFRFKQIKRVQSEYTLKVAPRGVKTLCVPTEKTSPFAPKPGIGVLPAAGTSATLMHVFDAAAL